MVVVGERVQGKNGHKGEKVQGGKEVQGGGFKEGGHTMKEGIQGRRWFKGGEGTRGREEGTRGREERTRKEVPGGGVERGEDKIGRGYKGGVSTREERVNRGGGEGKQGGKEGTQGTRRGYKGAKVHFPCFVESRQQCYSSLREISLKILLLSGGEEKSMLIALSYNPFKSSVPLTVPILSLYKDAP